jgi:hypothetical protein
VAHLRTFTQGIVRQALAQRSGGRVAPRVLAVSLGLMILAGAGAIGAGPAAAQAVPQASAACPVGSSAPCQQAFFQISRTTGAVTGAVALPGGNVEGQDYDGVVCTGAGTGTCYLAADHNGFLLATISSFACNPVAKETPIGTAADFTIDSMAYDPANSTLYATVGDQVSTINQSSGALTQTSTWMGDAAGGSGTVELDKLDALTYDAASGDLLGVVDQGTRSPLLVHLDPATGGVVHNAFGSGVDYVTVGADGPRTEIDGVAMVGGTLYASISMNDESSTDPHLATLNPSTGAATDIGSAGVPSIGGLTADTAGNLYAVSGTGGAVINTLPCPSATPPVEPRPVSPAGAVAPAATVAGGPASVLGVQVAKPGQPAEPTLPVTGFDAFPIALVAAACLIAGAALLGASRQRLTVAVPGSGAAQSDEDGAGAR